MDHCLGTPLVCYPPDTAVSDIEDAFKSFTNRPDIAILLINQTVCLIHTCTHTCTCTHTHIHVYNTLAPPLTDFSLGQIAEMIRHLLDRYEQPIPAVLEIPSKDMPYDHTKDSILRRAKVSYT